MLPTETRPDGWEGDPLDGEPTSTLREKIPISAPGSRMKHTAPTSMRLAEMSGDLCTVSRQRAYFCAAQL